MTFPQGLGLLDGIEAEIERLEVRRVQEFEGLNGGNQILAYFSLMRYLAAG